MYLDKIQNKKGGEEMQNEKNRMSVAQAAQLLGASEQFIRVGLQNKQLPIGFAVKTSGQWSYVITKQLFEAATGIKVVEVW